MAARWMTGVLAVLLVCSVGGLARAQQFTNISPALNIPGSIGAAWGDYDGDGYPDLILTSAPSGHWPLLLHNNGDLTFSDVSAQMGFPATADEQDGVAWADYDNDGDIDLIVACGSGSVKLYRNDADGFSDVAAAAGVGVADGPGRGVAWCDYDADSWLDVFVCNTMANLSHLLRNNRDGTFSDANTAAGMTGLAAPSAGNAAAWGDYDNDGRPDLMLSRMGARPLLYHNEGDGTFTEVGLVAGLDVAVDTFGVAWGDYDNDGLLDCYLGSAAWTRDWLFHNNGDGTFTDVAATAGMAADGDAGVGVAWADYDNDAWLDLYVGNINTGNEPFLYHNNGDGTLTDVAATAGVVGSRPNEAAAWADMDLDGRMDVFSGVGGPLSALFHNIGSTGNWLRLRALTNATGAATVSDFPARDAIGARVELNLDNDDSFPISGHRTLTRLIDGGSGFCAQNEQVAHFGVGASPLVCARVLFPDGSVVTHRSVPVNQQITIRDVPADRTEEIFDDVPLDFWAYEATKGCVQAAIVAGYDDGLYHPEVPVTRDQMAVFISRAMAGGDENVPAGPETATFDDVPTDYWAYDYVEYCVANDVVQGYSPTTYGPANLVNRDSMAVFIARADAGGDAGVPDGPETATFDDVPTDYWSYKYIEYCVAESIVQGYSPTTYGPTAVVSRDQMAVFITRAFGLL